MKKTPEQLAEDHAHEVDEQNGGYTNRTKYNSFMAGYNARAEEDKWIDVKEQVPDVRVKTCLVCNSDAPEYNQHIFIATWFGQSNTFRADGHGYLGNITHWRPLPPLPTTKTQ